MKKLSNKQIILLHQILIEETGGLDGLRDEGLLDSAVHAPFQTFDGLDLYPSVHTKAARLAYALIKNHPFLDGNKRIGILSMLTFLELNGVTVECGNDDLIMLGQGLADGSMNDKQLEEWILSHS